MSADRKADAVQTNPDRINFTVASPNSNIEIEKSVSELYGQILLKSKIQDILASRMINGTGCSRLLYGAINDENKLTMLSSYLNHDEVLMGIARKYYPPIAIGSYLQDKTAAGKYIIGASLSKYAEKNLEAIRLSSKSKNTVTKSESLELQRRSDYYISIKKEALHLLEGVVTYEPSLNIIPKVEEHFQNHQKKRERKSILDYFEFYTP